MAEWDDEIDREQRRQDKKLQYGLAAEQRAENEILLEQDEHPNVAADESAERALLKRDVKAAALRRMEDAARTLADFERVVAAWDKEDANRERRERYHEVLRSGFDIPLDYGASEEERRDPKEIKINHVIAKQLRKGNFIDAIFFCPFELHELVAEEYQYRMLKELKDDHKELLFLLFVLQYSTTKAAALRGQTDRNIRKVRATILKKLHLKLLAALQERVMDGAPLTSEEKAVWFEYEKTVLDGSKGGQYNCNQNYR